MSCRTNTNVDENIERIFYKSSQFVTDALKQGNMSIQTGKELLGNFFDLLKQGDPVAEQFMKMAYLHLEDNKDFKRETVSPDEEAFFQEALTRWENRELEI